MRLFRLLGEREKESTFREVLILAVRFRWKTACLVGWERQNRLDGLRLRMRARRILSRFSGARDHAHASRNCDKQNADSLRRDLKMLTGTGIRRCQRPRLGS